MSRATQLPVSVRAALAQCMRIDRVRLTRQIQRAHSSEHLQQRIQLAQSRMAAREGRRPHLEFDQDLPINHYREQIETALNTHQVLVVCGATGSGKSTQLPKICLSAGRGSDGYIGHTQPRRIAARSIAARLAQETGTELGGAVGYKVRFSERMDADGYIKVLTDGMLLAELETDRDLDQYDTLILDEAHERSLNIDFLLGYLKRLLPRRPDLKLIITSATIDPQSFASHFDDAPVIEVSGRSHPIEVRYRPYENDEQRQDRNLLAATVKAIEELEREGPGDVLVFLPGEREIHELTRVLRKRPVKHTEIAPLYARLPTSEQQRVFATHAGRRIVLATNVAETSLTVPGIRYVVDSGLARISRYNPGRQVQRLPIEPIAQSSALQRTGRCGRTGPGICIRLYSERDYTERDEFTEPEILRTSLAAVILRMQNMGLGTVEAFPFIAPPPERMINDGYRLLEELGAVDKHRRLTRLGKQLARLPVDPRIARIIIAAAELGALSEILTITAVLEVNDPRDFSPLHPDKARAAHARFTDAESDFLTMLKLWHTFHKETRGIGQRRVREYCREHFLSYPRMREWIDVRNQLVELTRELHLKINAQPATNDQVHQALLAGLLGNIAQADEEQRYLGTRGKHLYLHPGSAGFKRRPKWIVAAEIVETGKLYARTCAAIKPEWVEPLANDLLSRSYLEPHWEQSRGQVVAYEQVSLYGLVIISRRKVNFGPLDPQQSREIFIRGALVAGELSPLPAVIAQNQALITELERLEHKSRRRDVLVDDETLYGFYSDRVPGGLYDARSFSVWLQEHSASLGLTEDDLMRHDAAQVTAQRFPDHLQIHDNLLALQYNFQPGHHNDGVTVKVPLPLLSQLRAEPFTWLVPGLLLEKIIALIRSLPKHLRRSFVPVPDAAEKVLGRLKSSEQSLNEALARELSAMTGVTLSPSQFDESKLAPHLFVNFAAVAADDPQHVIDSDRDLKALRERCAGSIRSSAAAGKPSGLEREDLHTWDFGDLPESIQWQHAGITMTGFPALVDCQDSAAIRVFENTAAAKAAMRTGILRLLLIQLPQQAKHLRKGLPNIDTLALVWSGRLSKETLVEDVTCAAGTAVIGDANAVRNQGEFEKCLLRARRELVPAATVVVNTLMKIVPEYRSVMQIVDKSSGPAADDALVEIEGLIYPGFISATAQNWLNQYPRYFKALHVRLQRSAEQPAKDAAKKGLIDPYQKKLDNALKTIKGPPPEALIEYKFLLQEYRVSLFAQPMRTVVPVSPKRLDQQWKQVQSELAL